MAVEHRWDWLTGFRKIEVLLGGSMSIQDFCYASEGSHVFRTVSFSLSCLGKLFLKARQGGNKCSWRDSEGSQIIGRSYSVWLGIWNGNAWSPMRAYATLLQTLRSVAGSLYSMTCLKNPGARPFQSVSHGLVIRWSSSAMACCKQES